MPSLVFTDDAEQHERYRRACAEAGLACTPEGFERWRDVCERADPSLVWLASGEVRAVPVRRMARALFSLQEGP